MVLGTSRNRNWIAYNASHTPKVKWPTNRESYRIVGNCPCHLSNSLHLTHLWNKKASKDPKKNGLGRKKQSSRRLRRGFPRAGWKLLSKKNLAKKLWTSYLKVAETGRMENYLRLRNEETDLELKHKKHLPIWEVRSPNSHRFLWKKNPMIFTWHE